MKIYEAIRRVDELKQNAFTDEQKIQWIIDCESKILNEIWLLNPVEIQKIVSDYNEEKMDDIDLAVDIPFSNLYTAWLSAMIDYNNGEYNKYNNTNELFNSRYREYSKWISQTYSPADQLRRYI